MSASNCAPRLTAPSRRRNMRRTAPASSPRSLKPTAWPNWAKTSRRSSPAPRSGFTPTLRFWVDGRDTVVNPERIDFESRASIISFRANNTERGWRARMKTYQVSAAMALLLAALSGAGAARAQSAAAAWKPTGNVEFVVGAGAGGENDRIARAIQRVLTKEHLVDTMTVLNRPGAGQIIAMN